MSAYVWVVLGSALGGLLRFSLTRLTPGWNATLPWSTIAINILGSFAIGYFGSLTLAGGRFAVSDNIRLFAMVGVCGGFTTFSSFSLQTFDLLRSGSWPRALLNMGLSVLLCLLAVAVGHKLGERGAVGTAVAQTADEKSAG